MIWGAHPYFWKHPYIHEKLLFHQTSIKKWLFGVPGIYWRVNLYIYSYTMATHLLLACCLLQVHELPAPCAAFVGSTAISGSGDRSINLCLGNWLHQSKVVSHQWLFLVPLNCGLGSIVHPPIGSIYHLYIPLIVLAFWGVICYLPPLRGTWKIHWNQAWLIYFDSQFLMDNWITSPGGGIFRFHVSFWGCNWINKTTILLCLSYLLLVNDHSSIPPLS